MKTINVKYLGEKHSVKLFKPNKRIAKQINKLL